MSFLTQILVMARLNHKRGRKSNYVKSLNNSSHKEGKRLALQRDGSKCRRCSSTTNLEYHHISYHISGKELEKDNLKWTVIVCGKCHESIHKKILDDWNPKNPGKLFIL